jgi:hypothetical protein
MKTTILLLVFIFLFISCGKKEETINTNDEQFVLIQFKYDRINELNTFDKTFTKNLMIEGEIKIPFALSKQEQESIIYKCEEIDFFGLPNTLLNPETKNIMPESQSFIKIEYKSIMHDIIWDGMPPKEFSTEHQRIVELASFIKNIVERSPEYKKLPQSFGGY